MKRRFIYLPIILFMGLSHVKSMTKHHWCSYCYLRSESWKNNKFVILYFLLLAYNEASYKYQVVRPYVIFMWIKDHNICIRENSMFSHLHFMCLLTWEWRKTRAYTLSSMPSSWRKEQYSFLRCCSCL